MTTATREVRAGLTPAQLKTLKAHVITLTDGRLDREPTPDPRTVADYATTEADLDAIFATHLPAFLAERNLTSAPIVLYAHGGLIDEAAGFAGAWEQVDWWKANGVYPIHFVWKTGALSAIWDAIGRWMGGGGRGWLEEGWDRVVEQGARLLGGEFIWLDMKLDAAAASDPQGGARAFVTRLARWMKKHPDTLSVHAVGHSAGSIFHAHLLPAALDAGVPRIQTVSFLAPAVRMDTFRSTLLPRADRIGNLAVFTMTDQGERDDNCLGMYRKSLLYLVSSSFEPTPDTPLLGLARDIERDPEVKAFLTGAGGGLVWAHPSRPTPLPASTATSHGDFDNDGPTMDSVLLRVTGLTEVAHPFPASRAVEPLPGVAVPAAPRGAGGRTALCVGINEYAEPGDRLQGAVSDALLWERELRAAGFAVTLLTDRDATGNAILGSAFRLVTTARPGDQLVFQYSGHGTFAPDAAGGDEDDRQDEALCPVDFRSGGLVLDDQLAEVWQLIPPEVSLTIFFDSCHSGGANRRIEPGLTDLPRGVELTARDVEAFRIARGRLAPRGRKRALEMVRATETTPVDVPPRVERTAREVLFAACTPTQFAWESNGQGDFTGFVAPLVAGQAGRVTNRAFFDAITAGFDARRQNPTFTAAPEREAAPLLAAELAGAGQPAAAEGRPPVGSSAAAGTGTAPVSARDAAIAAVLRGVAALVEAG